MNRAIAAAVARHRLLAQASTSVRSVQPILARTFADKSNDIKEKVQVLRHEGASKMSHAKTEQHIAGLQQQIREAYSKGDYKTALEVGFDCRDAIRDHFGEAHPVFASAVTNIALMHKNLGEHEEAVSAYEFALRTYKESVGEQHASFATTLYNLAFVYKSLALETQGMEKLNARESALECFNECLNIRREILDPTHTDIALCLSNIGVLKAQNKKTTEGIEDAEKARDMMEKKLGKESGMTALTLNNLAYVYKEAGRFDESIRLFEDTVAIRKSVLGEAHNETIMAMHNLAEAHRANGSEEKAVDIQNQIVAIFDAE